MSIRRKLIFIFLAINAVPIFLLGALSFIKAKDSLRKLTLEALTNTTDYKEGEIFFYLENLRTRTMDFASDGFVREALEMMERTQEDDSLAGKLSEHLIFNKKPLGKDIQLIDILDSEGRVALSTDPERVGLDLSGEKGFARGKEKTYIHELDMEEGTVGLDVYSPILSNIRPFRILGVLVNHFHSSKINNILTGHIYSSLGAKTSPRGLGETGETYLVNQDRFFISDSLFVKNAAFHQRVDTLPVKRCFEENLETNGIWTDYRGKTVVGASMCLDLGDYKWALVSEQDVDEAFAPINRLRNLCIAIGGTILFFAGLAAFFIAKTISDPILALERGAELIGKGNLDHKVGTAARDEVGRLSRAFDRMTGNLKTVTASRDDLDKAMDLLKNSQAQLVHAEKMSAVGLMTAGVAHELNNPMMGLLNFIQYCLKHTQEDDRRHHVLKDAEREVLRCCDIVKNLLTFSRMEAEGAEAYRRVDCSLIFERIFKLLAYRMDTERVSISCHAEEGTPEIWVKENSIQQVFLGLVNNALDAMKKSKKKELRVHIRANGPHVLVSVADTGAGMAPENAQRIFDPFFTTKPVGEGTGLGLSICHNIVKAHGGEITFESKLGEGTVFSVSLPIEKRRE